MSPQPPPHGPSTVRLPLGAAPTRLGRWVGSFRVLASLGHHCVQRLRSHNAMALSAALSYRTVFALVPSLVLAFLVLKAGGIIESGKKSLHEVLETAGLTQINVRIGEPTTAVGSAPSERVNVADQIETVVANVEQKLTFARLGPVGLILLAWSAITLLTTIERSLNRIFEAPRARPLATRVLLYWAAFTFVPIVLVAASYLGAVGMQMARSAPGIRTLVAISDLAGNALVGVILLACVYKFLPNTHVSLRSALLGAAVVAPLWILARWFFFLYINTMVVSKPNVYGALGLLPLFLLWINVSWYVFLFGAEVAYAAANLRRLEAAEVSEKLVLGPTEMLAAAVAVAGAYAAGRGPTPFDRVAEALGLPDSAVRRLLDRLLSAGVLCPVQTPAGEAFVPARPIASIGVCDVLDLGESDDEGNPWSAIDLQVVRAVGLIKERTHETLGGTTLADLVKAKV